MKRLPITINPSHLLWASGAFLLITGNLEFFRQTTLVYPIVENWPFLSSLTIVVFCAIVLCACVFSVFLPVRVVVVLFLLVGAVTGHFSDGMSVVVDTEMIRNVFHTDAREVGDLVNWTLAGRVFLLGILPSAAAMAVRLRLLSPTKRQLMLASTAGICLLTITICVAPFGDAYASYAREHKPLRYYTNPTYPIYSAIKLAIDSNRVNVNSTYVTKVGSANIPPDDKSRELIIVVVGETARADHFGINGYERQTTPKLSARKRVVSFTNMKSCGTSTARSLPCIFSLDGREDFEIDSARFTENVLDVLAKAGVSILWRDNNSGAHGVADRVLFERFTDPNNNPVCADRECRDIGMLAGLEDYIATQDGDILIVLHQSGSHGPAYFKRYPDDFRVFKPDCRTNELAECSQQEIVNAYDNTILYTDNFLDAVIGFLEDKQDRYETAMLYLSDHGESLGEMGVYLHGMPYAFAPDAQTHIPFVVWAGERSDIDFDKMRDNRDRPTSHDDFSRILLQTFEIVVDGKMVDTRDTGLPMNSKE